MKFTQTKTNKQKELSTHVAWQHELISCLAKFSFSTCCRTGKSSSRKSVWVMETVLFCGVSDFSFLAMLTQQHATKSIVWRRDDRISQNSCACTQISQTDQQCSIFNVWKELTLCHLPPVYIQAGKTYCFWSWYSETIIICHPTLKSSHPKWHPSKWMSNEDKSAFWEQPPDWKELRPCVGECVKEAERWRRHDTGLRAEEQRVVVRRMNSDWRSAQWQLNDLRSVDSVSINQTALSRSCLLFFLPLPLALISSFVSNP